jgi:hypothetical protein
MVRVPLLPTEEQLHLDELAKLRQHLFRRRTPVQCWIVSETVIEPHAQTMRHLHNNQSYRVLSKGGLQFELKFPIDRGPRWVSVQHWDGDNYSLYACIGKIDSPARYGQYSLTVEWNRLEPRFLEIIAQLKKSDESLPEKQP